MLSHVGKSLKEQQKNVSLTDQKRRKRDHKKHIRLSTEERKEGEKGERNTDG